MDLMYRIVYSSACRSTHHKFALDALNRLALPAAQDWRSMFLGHYKEYLRGAKDPDDRFRDFKNHVLHVREDYWGGAIESCNKWYRIASKAMADQDWSHAVYSCGVLSHYVTDPVMPFHTGQNEVEGNIHRACEWSINRSYDDLFQLMQLRKGFPTVALPSGEDWLSEAIVKAAEYSHQFYDELIEHYNFDQGVRNPKAGLDPRCRDIIAQLFGYSIQLWANILSQLLVESGSHPPESFLSLPGLVAGIEAPFRFVVNAITDSQERELVERIHREWKATGTVTESLPLDDRTIDRLYRDEVLSGDWAETCRLREAAGRSRVRAPLPAPVERTDERPLSAIDPNSAHADPLLNREQQTDSADIHGGERSDGILLRPARTKKRPTEVLSSIVRKVGQGGRRPQLDKGLGDTDESSSNLLGDDSIPKSGRRKRKSATTIVTPVNVDNSFEETAPQDSDSDDRTEPIQVDDMSFSSVVDEPSQTWVLDDPVNTTSSEIQEVEFPDETNQRGEEVQPSEAMASMDRLQASPRTIGPPSEALGYDSDEVSEPVASHTGRVEQGAAEDQSSSPKSASADFELELSDPVVDAPAIGGKTSKRLQKAGVKTVLDLLSADPDDLAHQVPAKYVDAQQVLDWQDQARLVCQIPGLSGHASQLLVGCDYRSPGQIAACDADSLFYEIDTFARTGEGLSILGNEEAPTPSDISDWIANASNTRTLRAA